MNPEALRRTASLIEGGEVTVDLRVYYRYDHECGTFACVAGAAALANGWTPAYVGATQDGRQASWLVAGGISLQMEYASDMVRLFFRGRGFWSADREWGKEDVAAVLRALAEDPSLLRTSTAWEILGKEDR